MTFSIGNKKTETVKTTTFSKEQLVSSKKYRNQRDLVKVLLVDDRLYSFEEVDILINKFMKGKVK